MKKEYEHFIWDKFSDQPCVIENKKFKKNARLKYLLDYLRLFITTIFILPISLFFMLFLKNKNKKSSINFYGIGVNLDKGNIQQDLVEELGVKNLLIRIPLSDIENLDKYYEFCKSFTKKSKKNIVLNIIQNRENIDNLELFAKNITLIFNKFNKFVYEYQIATTINRIKWGFFAPCEYLRLYKIAYDIKCSKFPDIRLIGPSVIDFEYHYAIRALFNFYNLKFDIANALLYVDRRGSPFNKQYLFFDTLKKVKLFASLAKLSPKTSNKVYITEVNWPLKDTAPYAPTSQKECVSNEEYCKYMLEYHKIVLQTGLVEKVFWHQLVAPGYGLVDNRDGKVIKLPQFYAYKEMINARD
ncbi:hypothetical protein CBLAS_1144 [Campylobacter blaseri]|uniref:Glycosyl hydrolase n=1 Tax=Campylobacter blaseri TaxID=2042961 RepID=A0A2P8QZQ3_9BACT|nr:hypothetical protein [Campylobacter blaseri]PSM51720.1 hypothetical protein CQ405_06200 [Campylobacter blaseri]PSM53511.1 hypothetical protein CRN67_06205 [Campylobacter blaseri]QKF86317.1 hypothetical protein CBLAS_1144 [Campylobacter blaseri]